MLQKLGNYFVNVFKKYGVVIPAILLVVAFAIMISLDVTDAFTAIKRNSVALLVVIGCVVGLAFVAGAVLAFLKRENAKAGLQDLAVIVIAALTLLMMIMFIFTGGKAGSVVTICKWAFTAFAFVVCIALAVVRSNHVSE